LIEELFLDLAGNGSGEWPDDEGNCGPFEFCVYLAFYCLDNNGDVLTHKNQRNKKRRHDRSLGIVHKVPVAHELFGLRTNFAVLALRVPRRNEMLAKVLANVLDDETGFGNYS
jgi:hypothetical protein